MYAIIFRDTHEIFGAEERIMESSHPTAHPFDGAEIISRYTRAQALEDGVLVDLMQDTMRDVARQHYRYPVACTAAVWDILLRRSP